MLLVAASCQLTRSQRRQYYARSSHVWTITDEVLEELDNDVQAIVLCAYPNDTILVSTKRTIQPRRSIVISTNLTISSQLDGPLFRNGIVMEAESKVKFSCLTTGDLFTIR